MLTTNIWLPYEWSLRCNAGITRRTKKSMHGRLVALGHKIFYIRQLGQAAKAFRNIELVDRILQLYSTDTKTTKTQKNNDANLKVNCQAFFSTKIWWWKLLGFLKLRDVFKKAKIVAFWKVSRAASPTGLMRKSRIFFVFKLQKQNQFDFNVDENSQFWIILHEADVRWLDDADSLILKIAIEMSVIGKAYTICKEDQCIFHEAGNRKGKEKNIFLVGNSEKSCPCKKKNIFSSSEI